jgi:hypothetical protein
MDDKKTNNHVLALKQALARKHAATHPDAGSMEPSIKTGRAPVLANKPQKKVTGRGR